MKLITITKAGPTLPNTPTESCLIVIDTEPFEFDTLGEQDLDHYDQANQIEDALYKHLPGGIYDRLVGAMLARKASHFRVSHNQ